MDQALKNAVAAVANERGGRFQKAFDSAKVLVSEYGEEGLAERVATEVPAAVPWEVVADLLGILVWSTSDNGAAIHAQAEKWLIEARDGRRAQIALHLEAYPFETLEEMKRVLSRVAEVFPDSAMRCRALVNQRSERCE